MLVILNKLKVGFTNSKPHIVWPIQLIHAYSNPLWTPIGKTTFYENLKLTCCAVTLKTPSVHCLVSRSICPSSWVLGIAFGLIVDCWTGRPIFCNVCFRILQMVVLPEPDGPTMTTPILCCSCSYSSRHLRSWKMSNYSLELNLIIFLLYPPHFFN